MQRLNSHTEKLIIVVNNLGAGMLEVCSLPKKEALKYQVYGGAKGYEQFDDCVNIWLS